MGLKAAGANPWADGGQNVLRAGAVEGGHLRHCLGGNAQAGPPPAGVNGGDGLPHRVVEENGDAVGVVDGEGQARRIGDQPIHPVVDGVQQVGEDVGGSGHPDPVLVDLVGHHQAGFVHADGGAEAVVVLPDRRPLVRAGDAQVQLGIRAGTHAPQPGGETVGHPAGGGEGVCRVEGDAVVGLLGK